MLDVGRVLIIKGRKNNAGLQGVIVLEAENYLKKSSCTGMSSCGTNRTRPEVPLVSVHFHLL